MTLFSLAGSLNYASHIQQPESGSERKTSDTCGPKCLESFERFNHVGLWAKTFSALLIGTGDWYSKRCKLTWKVKGTKYNRLYFQLQASAIAPTNGTEFGLLPTPRAQEIENSKQRIKENRIDSITTMAKLGLLPTPRNRDYKGARSTEALEASGRTATNSLPDSFSQTGKTSQLNPRFVAEMMGFPSNWLELPFQNTETNQSRPPETQSVPK